MVIGKRIKDLRHEKGMTQGELGDILGVTKVSICGYENGTRTPSLDTFKKIAEVFETTTDYLLGREVSVLDKDTNEKLGNISSDDVKIIEELKGSYPKLYDRIFKDTKRYIGLISRKMS